MHCWWVELLPWGGQLHVTMRQQDEEQEQGCTLLHTLLCEKHERSGSKAPTAAAAAPNSCICSIMPTYSIVDKKTPHSTPTQIASSHQF